jgi:hypothetical protein
MEMTRKPTPNRTYPKVAVQWLNQALCYYQSFAWLTVDRSEIPTCV